MKSELETIIKPNKLKKVVRSKGKTGKLSKPTINMIIKATELFTKELFNQTVEIAEFFDQKHLQPSHFREAVDSNPKFVFLQQITNQFPKSCFEENFKKQKRNRSEQINGLQREYSVEEGIPKKTKIDFDFDFEI